MKLLIGGSGFIGTAFQAHLDQQQQEYIAVSRAPRKSDDNLVSRDTFYSARFKAKIQAANSIFYLASATAPRNCQSISKEVETNVVEFQRYMEHALSVNPNLRIIYLSSGGQVYGTKIKARATEEQITAPETPYAIGKVMIEESIKYFARNNSVSYSILRPSNPIGSEQMNHRQGVIPALFNSAINNTPFKIVGNLQSARDYIHVADVCRAMSLAETFKGNEIWNVGSGLATTLEDIIKLVEQETKTKLNIENHSRLSSYKLDRIVLDSSKIEKDLGWKPHYSLMDAIRECSRAFQARPLKEKQLDLSAV
ncbi:NAD-dependent epimerase/dehydratase family protein [Microbulbifer sp. ALW1]|uniref:NAD-dependent epimerase/dehydratase family protein n=1 Tax=Microbulbifer sp. (strain ALW1) TaxID=1516059 RepID=UPI00135819D5|nr:NAD-dependent epimerase/dehydratase family protein [Microbulbifer sp. ALW1]